MVAVAERTEINLDQAAIVREAALGAILPMIDEEIDRLLEPENLTQVVRDRLLNRFARPDETPGTYHAPFLEVTSELVEAEVEAIEAEAIAQEEAESSAAPPENSAPEISLKLPKDIRRNVTKSQIQKNLQLALPKGKAEQILYLEQITGKSEAGLAFLDRILDAVVAVFGGDRPSPKSYLNAARKLLAKLNDTPAADPN